MKDKILWISDIIKEKIAKTQYLEPDLLVTKNRFDLQYRIIFLKDILDSKKEFNQTLYYHFIADNDHGLGTDPNEESTKFLKLYNDIKKNGILQPIPVAHFSKKIIHIRYFFQGKKYWSEFSNESGFQALGGAHRISVAKYLGYKKIPVKIFSPSKLYEITNYTDFIKLKEKKYVSKINELKSKKDLK